MLTSPASIEIVKSKSLTTFHSQFKGVTMKKYLLVFICMFLSLGILHSQDLQSTLNQLAGDATLGYVDPITQGFLTNLNGGLFHKAPQTKLFGFDLEIGAVVMGTPLGNLDKEFSGSGAFRFNKLQADDLAAKTIPTSEAFYNEKRAAMSDAIQNSTFTVTISGPTVVGKKFDIADPTSEVKVDVNGNVVINYQPVPGGPTVTETKSLSQVVNTGLGGVGDLGSSAYVPFFAPQITLGTLVGTQFTLRYVPKIPIPDVGDLSWTGFGIQHNIGYWLPIPVVDLAVSFYTQKIKIDPIFEMSGTAFGLNASKQFGFAFLNVTPYAGFMLESSKMKVHYTPPAADYGPGITPPDIAFEIKGKNTSRLTLGLSLRLLIFNINADYNIGKYNGLTAGLFFAI